MRRKHSNLRVVHGNTDQLDAEAEALLADIASFDIDAARQRVQEIDARASGLRVSSTQFPDTLPQVCLDSDPTQYECPRVEVPTFAAPSQAVPVKSPTPAHRPLGGGLLDQLKDEVVVSQRRADDLTRRVDAVRDSLDRRLRSMFDYFHDLTTQLNYLKPRVGREYYFLGPEDAFKDLTWLEGFADFRTQSESDGGRIERVTLGYTLKGPADRTLDRSGSGIERLRQVLFDLGLRFECIERRNSQRELEHASFRILDEVSVRVVWRADFEKQQVVMESRNLERLGFASCTFLPESIGPEMLDEFGRLVLGRANTFRSFVSR